MTSQPKNPDHIGSIPREDLTVIVETCISELFQILCICYAPGTVQDWQRKTVISALNTVRNELEKAYGRIVE